MLPFVKHAMLPKPTHDEAAMQAFVKSLRGHLASRVMPGTYAVYQARIEPAFKAKTGRVPQDQHEVRKLMEADPYYQFWSAMQRRSQELMWDTVLDSTERELPDLIGRARKLQKKAKGSLRLDPNLQVPRYHTAADIHLQPGGYHTEFTADDVAMGAVYDYGIYIYLNGALGPTNNAMGMLLTGYVQEKFPGFRPAKILDMGCAIGNSTLEWKRAFPKAEVHGIDVGAPVLRYAHARAEALGVPVHFSQQNAEKTGFADGSFDLVISHIMLHETSKSALVNILRECHRLLRPGGRMIHLEIPRGNTPLEKFMYNWETYNNNETFAGFMTDLDLKGEALKGGFEADKTFVDAYAPRMSSEQKNYSEEFTWKILVGEK
ncbi:MAG: class I SAM-dependent methyltransferase [Steroidobacteraceae bacterium]|jgi:ubiquinone/menaquinone biosynthesis C-methylase UbiE|nr:class I SAM-dependent methyltransferase [Steroidobacteraceae bacterium]